MNVFYGSALIHGSTISGNTALYDDAAIQARGSFVDVHDTSIVDNESYDDVINVYESEVVITDSTISGNTGGDELIDGYESELAIRQTTIASNDVTALIDVAYTSLEVTQSTLSGNTLSDGEAIDAEYAEVTVNRSIIAGNGGARAFELYESSLDVRNSILPTVEQTDVIGEATVVERVIELTAGPTLGTATITVTASDGTATATETFEVEVLAATLPPTGSNSTNGLIAVVGASLIALGAGVRRTAKRQG